MKDAHWAKRLIGVLMRIRLARFLRFAIRRSSAVRALAKSRQMQHLINTQRAARKLTPRVRFLRRQLGTQTSCYKMIHGGPRFVYLRHRSRDLSIFNEIFSRRSYEPPEAISSTLAELGELDVLDLGGNIGLFGVFAIGRWPIAMMRSFEPEPANAALLAATIKANGAGSTWQLDRRAVSSENTQAGFTQGLYADGHLAVDGQLKVAVADLFEQQAPHLLKMDIEGGEWPLLTDPRLAAYDARVIVLEWHARECPTSEPHGLARKSLLAAGYTLVADVPAPTRCNGLVWALRA